MTRYSEVVRVRSNVSSRIKIMKTNRNETTRENYENKAMQLRHQASKAYGYTSPYAVSAVTVVDHLIARKSAISKNTWRQYKAALRHHFEECLRSENVDLAAKEDLFAAVSILETESSVGALKKGIATSAKKQKGIRQSDFEILIRYLSANVTSHRYAAALRTWISAAKITGLRPVEWNNAGIVYDDLDGECLRVLNAKATNNRGNGEYRHLPMKDMTELERQCVYNMVEMLDGFANEIPFDDLQKYVSDYMHYATRKCFGRRQKYPTLYSFRHQFTADAKSTFTKQEVAALLGHASDETAGLHYARTVSKQSSVNIKPLASEVANVRRKSVTFTPKNKPE